MKQTLFEVVIDSSVPGQVRIAVVCDRGGKITAQQINSDIAVQGGGGSSTPGTTLYSRESSLNAFLNERVELLRGDNEAFVLTPRKLLQSYLDWCASRKLQPGTASTFALGRVLAAWVRSQLSAAGWTPEKIVEFLHDRNFKRRRGVRTNRTDFLVRVQLRAVQAAAEPCNDKENAEQYCSSAV